MRIILSTSHSPAYNLAIEEYLFSVFDDDIALLYVNNPCVVVGSNQVVRNEVNVLFCRSQNIPILRRMSGGGTVYQDMGNLNYSFISSRRGGLADMEGNFLKPIITVLALLEVKAEVGTRKDLWISKAFKISGTASHIRRQRELHHGTLLYDADLKLLKQVLQVENPDESIRGTASVPSPVINIRDFYRQNGLPDMHSEVFFERFTHLLADCYNCQPEYVSAHPEIDKLVTLKYNSKDWNFKK